MDLMEAIPEKFHETPEGAEGPDAAASITKLVGAYNELGGKVRQTEEDWRKSYDAELAANAPKPPETADAYKGFDAVPEGLSLPGEVTVEELNGDPMLGVFRQVAHKLGLPDEQFQTGATAMLEVAAQMHADGMAQIQKELGENAAPRLSALDKAMRAKLGDAGADALQGALSDVNGIKALETLFTGDGSIVNNGGGDSGQTVTREELENLMKTEKYWRDKDPALHKQVAEGFKKLAAQG